MARQERWQGDSSTSPRPGTPPSPGTSCRRPPYGLGSSRPLRNGEAHGTGGERKVRATTGPVPDTETPDWCHSGAGGARCHATSHQDTAPGVRGEFLATEKSPTATKNGPPHPDSDPPTVHDDTATPGQKRELCEGATETPQSTINVDGHPESRLEAPVCRLHCACARRRTVEVRSRQSN